MSFNNPLKKPLHRKIENALSIERNCTKDQIQQLQKMGNSDEQIKQVCMGALEWMQVYAPDKSFPVVLQLYISCLKNPAPVSVN